MLFKYTMYKLRGRRNLRLV